MLRVFGSLAIFGVMVGLMIGRLTTPDPTELQEVQVQPNALVVWFNNEPKVHGEHIDGARRCCSRPRGERKRAS